MGQMSETQTYRGGLSMRKKLAVVTFVLAVMVAGAAAVLAPAPAAAKTCPKNSHLVVCPTGCFCCPNNALCVCFP